MNGQFAADYFDGLTSRRVPVNVQVEGGQVTIHGGDILLQVPARDAAIHPRIGSVPLRIGLPGGGLLVTRSFEDVDAALGIPRSRTLAHRLESHTHFVLACLVVILVAAWFAYTDGIPWAAKRLAQRIPPGIEAQLSAQTLETVDRIFFRTSTVAPDRRARIEGRFARLRARADVPPDTRLVFRNGGMVGPNALTLPGHLIVVTDQLVQALDDEEIAAILAHELGHVHYRHSTRVLLSGSFHALVVMAVFGDASSISSIAATAPTVLVNSGYSRDFEREADAFAFDLLERTGSSPEAFATALEDLMAAIGAKKRGIDFGYLSTHPQTGERIEAAREAAKRMSRQPR
ncbi:MAG TPA: M48 family metallopeptidase [Usitatibacter sp.]|nr:M48 family metallopeptidase [Usitatibacter sp.]